MELEKEFTFRNTALPQRCYNSFVDMRNEDKFCDIQFTAGDRRVSAHRVILAGAIPFFRETSSNDEEIPLPDIDPTVLECFVNYAYSCELKITMENVKGLLSGSCVMHVKEVQDACCDFLLQRLNPQTVLSFRDLANDLSLPQLKEYIDLYVQENFEEVSKTEEFLKSSFTYVKELISKDDLNVDNEEKILESVLRWVKASPIARKDNLPELLCQVRMVLLKPLHLTDMMEREELFRTSFAVRDLVDEARNYNLFPERRKTQCSFSSVTRQFMRIGEVPEETDKRIYSLNAATKYTVLHLDLIKSTWSTKFTQEYWTNNHCFAVLNNKLYFFENNYSFEYDPEKNNSRLLRTMMEPRMLMAAASVRNKILVCGGYSLCDASDTVECFDPEKNEWTRRNSLNTARWGPSAVSLVDYVYVLGGEDKRKIYGSVERYSSVTGKWQHMSSLLTPRSCLGSAVLNGKIYVCGGNITKSGKRCTATAEVYDPITNKWIFILSMNTARSNLNLLAFCGQLYAVAGKDSHGIALNSCEVYDPHTDKWRYGPSFGFTHLSSAVVAI